MRIAMGDTNAERQRKTRKRKRADGWKQIWSPPELLKEFRLKIKEYKKSLKSNNK